MSTSSSSAAGPRYDPGRTLRRLWWAKTLALAKLLGLTALVVWGFADGSWKSALAFALLQLPDAWIGWRAMPDADALDAGGDFLEAEREALEERLDSHRVRAITHVVLAAVLAWLATLGTRGAPVLWALAAFLVVQSIARVLFVLPAIARELRDFGIAPTTWTSAIVTAAFVLLAPFLVLFGFLYRGFRRLIGRPVPEEKDEDDA